MNLTDKFKTLDRLIGNTPLVEINFLYKNKPLKVYTKLEYYNFSGSIKDRMALHILKKAVSRNELDENSIILEATSGNTGISFAALGAFLNIPVDIVMPDWMSEERKCLLKSFGVNLTLISKKDGGFIKSVEYTKILANRDSRYYLPSQFSNNDNIESHILSTGPEIYKKMIKNHLKVDGFVAGVGTGGTVMGIGSYLKRKNNNIKVFPLEPCNSPTLSTGYAHGEHRIQGISDEFVPDIININFLDEIISVDDGDAIIMAQKLANYLGIGVGISSGANFLGAIKALELIGYDKCIVTIFPDDNKKYLSTDLMKKEPVKDYFLSKDVKLLNFKTL